MAVFARYPCFVLGLSLAFCAIDAAASSDSFIPAPPPWPSVPTVSVNVLSTPMPADLLQAPIADSPLKKVANSWVIRVDGALPVAEANAMVTKIHKIGYPAYMQTESGKTMLYIGPEIDQQRMEAIKQQLGKKKSLMRVLGRMSIIGFDPFNRIMH